MRSAWERIAPESPLAKASMTPITYSPMGTAWMPLAVVIVALLARGLSSSRSMPAEVSCTQRRLGARSVMSSGTAGEVNRTSASARMPASFAFASSSVSSSGPRCSA